MKVFYSRISSLDQNDQRQLQHLDGFDYVLTDKCSGSINLFDRAKGSQIKKLIDQQKLSHLEIHSIDRLGRNTIDVLKTWKELTDLGVKVVCRNPSLTNFKIDGTEDEISSMIISILSIMASFERKTILERQKEGIILAKQRGAYSGRQIGTQESKEKFIQKPRNQKILSYLEKQYPYSEISKIVGCSFSTINKVMTINKELASIESIR